VNNRGRRLLLLFYCCCSLFCIASRHVPNTPKIIIRLSSDMAGTDGVMVSLDHCLCDPALLDGAHGLVHLHLVRVLQNVHPAGVPHRRVVFPLRCVLTMGLCCLCGVSWTQCGRAHLRQDLVEGVVAFPFASCK
jgi:hypothetical protein